MHRRKRTLSGRESVELNLAAMLDMAFQLLTFFILTFRPAPVEGEIALKMPRAAAAESAAVSSPDPAAGLVSLTIRVAAGPRGEIAALTLGDENVAVERLAPRLKTLLVHPDSALQEIVIQAGSGLRYDALMNVVDQCARQKLSNGQPLKRLSFAEWRGT